MNKACPPPDLLPDYLLDLAYNAFERGIPTRNGRPTARDWYEGLLQLGKASSFADARRSMSMTRTSGTAARGASAWTS